MDWPFHERVNDRKAEYFESAYNINNSMNLASSLVESYMYADMFNREYNGGSNMQERIYAAGLPVEKIVPSIGKYEGEEKEQEGGGECKGPLSHKVVPAGLVIIQSKEYSNSEYENHFHPGVQREVIPDSIYEMLIMSVTPSSQKRRITPKKKSHDKKHSSSRKIKSNRHKE